MFTWLLDAIAALFDWFNGDRKFTFRNYLRNRRVSRWARKEDKKHDR